MKVDLRLGNSQEVLKNLPENSVDALVTDPPYLINFMGKEWDKENSPAGSEDFWKEVLRVMKPGAHGLVFGHSRQHHRVMTALEDAGFEIRDCLMWLYGSGFPKSHNISKAIEKIEGVEFEAKPASGVGFMNNKEDGYNNTLNQLVRVGETTANAEKWEGWGTALKPAYEPIILVRKPLEKKLSVATNVLKHGTGGLNIDASRVGTDEDFSNVKPRKMMANQGSVKTEDHDHTASETWQEAKDKLENLGRFPANVILSHHPDCKQVGEREEITKNHNAPKGTFAGGEEGRGSETIYREQKNIIPVYECVDGCAVKTLDEQSGITKGSGKPTITQAGIGGGVLGKHDGRKKMPTAKEGLMTTRNVGDSGGASRFFYCAKVSKKERNAGCDDFQEKEVRFRATKNGTGETSKGMERFTSVKKNTHPTVKPIALMTYLAKLITPPSGIVLDPFMGSGSTGCACAKEGFDFIGIEMEQEYIEISKARIAHYLSESKEEEGEE